MKRTAIVLAALIGLVGAGSGAGAAQPNGSGDKPAAATPIQPGYWEYTTRMMGIAVDRKKKCLQADEVEDFLTRPCNRHYTCVYPTKQVGGGKLLLDGYWQNKEGKRAKVHASGNYQPRAFALKANGTAIGGIPFVASMDAKWLSADCPTGA